jgi:hypothetical protein
MGSDKPPPPVSALVATGKRTGERVPLGPFFSSSSESHETMMASSSVIYS